VQRFEAALKRFAHVRLRLGSSGAAVSALRLPCSTGGADGPVDVVAAFGLQGGPSRPPLLPRQRPSDLRLQQEGDGCRRGRGIDAAVIAIRGFWPEAHSNG